MAYHEIYIYGSHAVRHALAEAPDRVLAAWLWNERQESPKLLEIAAELARHGIALQWVPRKTLDRLSGHALHQGVVLRLREDPAIDQPLVLFNEDSAPSHASLFLLLDGVEDPHNLGACLRTADAVGVDAVVIPRRRSVGMTGAVHKVASGAAYTVAVRRVGSLGRTMAAMRKEDITTIGFAASADTSFYTLDLTVPVSLVFGTERSGLSTRVRSECDRLVHIPMCGKVESLNLSVAAGLVLYEAFRQRQKHSDSSTD